MYAKKILMLTHFYIIMVTQAFQFNPKIKTLKHNEKSGLLKIILYY